MKLRFSRVISLALTWVLLAAMLPGYAVAQNTNVNGSPGIFYQDTDGHWAVVYIENLRTRCNVLGYADANGNLLHLFKPDNRITRAELAKIVAQCRYKNLPEVTQNPFPDVPKDHFAAGAIKRLKDVGVLEGYPDGTFRPDQNVNRAEALKIVLRSVTNDSELNGSSAAPFRDVDQSQWYGRYVNYGYEKKYISGDLDASANPLGTYRPGDFSTRAEMAKMAVNAIDVNKRTE